MLGSRCPGEASARIWGCSEELYTHWRRVGLAEWNKRIPFKVELQVNSSDIFHPYIAWDIPQETSFIRKSCLIRTPRFLLRSQQTMREKAGHAVSISGPWSSKLHLHTESRSSRTSGEHGSLRRMDRTDLNCESVNNGLPWDGQWHSRTKWPQEWFPALNPQITLSFTCLSHLSEGAGLFPQAFLSLGQLQREFQRRQEQHDHHRCFC